jgi:hypothetical protein
MNSTARFFAAAFALAVGTWLVGWWAIPVVALVLGVLGTRPASVAGAAAVAWVALLIVDATGGSITRLASVLAGVMGLPAPALFLVTVLFPAVVGWSAASLGDAARSIRATSRQPSSAPPSRPRPEP